MKKKFIITAFAVIMVTVASAQTEKQGPPEPPKPPTPPVEQIKDIPPPPPPPSEPPPPPKPPKASLEKTKDVPPPPPPPSEPPQPPTPPMQPTPTDELMQLPDDYEAFLKRNPAIKSLGWTMENKIIVRLKSGKEERYNLNDEKSKKEIEAKYGELPQAPPPPPLPPPPKKSKRTTS